MKGWLTILSLLLFLAVAAQEVPPVVEQQLENLNEETIEDDALLQQLAFFQKHPLNLNTATANELYLLRLLTELQVQNLLSYRSLFGTLLSIYELQAVPGFDPLTIRKLLPFVYAGAAQTLPETMAVRLREGSALALFRVSRVLERSRGYNKTLRTHYLGNPYRFQARFTYQYKHLLYYGVVADKDAGEQFFSGAQKLGFDFYSLHFFLRNTGRIKALAVGDYTLNLGQGLIQWQSLAFGKSADVMNMKRQSDILLPYRSAGEFYFNRGAAATLQLGPLQATAFVSYKRFSGNVTTDSAERFTSFGTSGYHRTQPEVADRNRLGHFSSGGALSFHKNDFKLSANAVMHRFSLPLQKQDEPYNRFALSGRSHFLASVDYAYTHKNIHLFGELATDTRFHRAMVHGALLSVDPKVDLSFFYRNIGVAFQSPFGNAFTKNTLPSNEIGFYTGIQLRPGRAWQLAAYADFYRFPFLKYRVSAPTRGGDYLVQLTYVPSKQTALYLRYRTETKPLDGTIGNMHFPQDQQRQNLRFHFLTQLNRTISLKARTEFLWFGKEGKRRETGILAFTEAAFNPAIRLKGTFRLQFFETESYDSRIYAYESDVLYSFSTPAFFDRGFRYYLNTAYEAGKHFTVWIRLAQTIYSNKEVIGSGLDEIEQNRKTELKWQVRYNF